MKILFIHEVNYEKKVIFEIQEYPELLSLLGHEVDFLQFPENCGIKSFSFRTKIKKINGRVYQNAKINLITPPTLGGTFLERLFSTVLIIPLLGKLISREKYDVVVLYAVPTSGWQAAKIAKIKKVPIIFRALDVSHLLRSGFTKKLVETAESIVYKNVDLISANNLALAKYCQKLSNKTVPVAVNYPPLDLSHFSENLNQISRSHYGLTDSDFVLLFMGTFYEFSGIKKVIQDLWISNEPNVKLLLVGGGVQEPKLKRLVAELGITDKVKFTGVVSYEKLPQILKLADVAFNSFEPMLVSNVAFPHKVLQYLASGVSTVSTKLEGLYSVLKTDAGVYWVDYPEEVFAMAIKIRSIPKVELSFQQNLGKEFVKSKFSKLETVKIFEETINKVVADKNG